MSISIRRTLFATAVVTGGLGVFAGAGSVAAEDDTPFDQPGLDFAAPTLPEEPPLPPEPVDPEVDPDLDVPDLDLTQPTLPEEPPFPPEPVDPEVNPELDVPDLDVTNPTLPEEPPFPTCDPYDPTALGITVADNGDGTAFVQIGYFDTENACNADVNITSYATNVDDSASAVLATDHTTINALEAAALGDGWFETDIALDPCFAKVVVDVDGAVMETEKYGLGCSISITKDFEGDPWNVAINLVHGPGWTPDHIFDVSSDDMVVWDELPSGDYTVSEFDGAVDGTTISLDGGAPSPHAGEPVAVHVGQSVLITNPDVTLDLVNPTVPDDDGEDPGEEPGEDPDPDDPGEDPEPTTPEPTDPHEPSGDLPTTGSSMTGMLVALGLLSGAGGLGCTALARRRNRND